MYCGVLCVRRLVKALGCDPGLITMITERSSKMGLSLFDLADCLENSGLSVRIHKGRLTQIEHPGFLFDGNHYLLLVRREGKSYVIYDPNRGDFRLPCRLLFVTGYQYFLEVVV